jgi:hypothetical protein
MVLGILAGLRKLLFSIQNPAESNHASSSPPPLLLPFSLLTTILTFFVNWVHSFLCFNLSVLYRSSYIPSSTLLGSLSFERSKSSILYPKQKFFNPF